MRVDCDIEEIELDGDFGMVSGLCATCSRCGHQTESFGTGAASAKRCLVLLREECPKDENNFYAAEEAEED